MANNYLQFSEVISQLTDDEIAWLKDQLKTVYVFDGTEYEEDQVPQGMDANKAKWVGCRAYRDLLEYSGEFDEGPGFEYQFRTDPPDKRWGRYLWVYVGETGSVSQLAHLVQKFLRTFRPRECWSLTYAFTCSQPRVGEFSGGGVFVTADEVVWNSVDDFVDEQREAFLRRQASAGVGG